MYYNFIIYFDLLLLKFSISMLNFQQDYVWKSFICQILVAYTSTKLHVAG